MYHRPHLALILTLLLTGLSCSQQASKPDDSKSTTPNSVAATAPVNVTATFTATPIEQDLPLGLPEFHVRDNNPMTQEKVALGRKLFFDKLLSADRSMSCATCHDPDRGWSNGERFAIGVHGEAGKRNVPTILNTAYYRSLFWDGRAGSLEGQALGPILNQGEMAMPSKKELVARLQGDEEYANMFAKAFSNGVTAANVANALASYERTIIAGNSPYDRFVAGDENRIVRSGPTWHETVPGQAEEQMRHLSRASHVYNAVLPQPRRRNGSGESRSGSLRDHENRKQQRHVQSAHRSRRERYRPVHA